MQLARARKVFVFLALAYETAWTLGFGFFASGRKLDSGTFGAMGTIYMFAPAAAAVITQKLLWKEIFLSGGNPLVVGITGGLGMTTLLLADAVLSLLLRSGSAFLDNRFSE
jgi:hypothetical protein